MIRLDLNGNVAMATEGTNICVPVGVPPVAIGAAPTFPAPLAPNPVVLDCGDGVKTNNDPASAEYKLVARAVDPDAVLFDGGIHIGWSDESSDTFEFAEEDVVPICGDENLDDGEECDDGNNVDGDGCSAVCTIEDDVVPICGDGNLDDGEECDDGNNVNGDGCSAECTVDGSGCSELAGAVTVDFTITYDPSGHGPFVGMPDTLDLDLNINGDVSVTGADPFVDVTGVTTDGSFTATGAGTVAGFSDIAVELTCLCELRTCFYQMGVNGGLPEGDEIEYSFDLP